MLGEYGESLFGNYTYRKDDQPLKDWSEGQSLSF